MYSRYRTEVDGKQLIFTHLPVIHQSSGLCHILAAPFLYIFQIEGKIPFHTIC